jgi:lysophospholipase L1-like esterase
LGDSTAVGVGAKNPDKSTAGRLGALYPSAEVRTIAKSGLKIDGLIDLLPTIPEASFDIILIQIGANDIIQLTRMDDIEKGIHTIVEDATRRGKKVIILHSGNIGEATMFPWYAQALFAHRSFAVRAIYKKEAIDSGVSYVDLIDSPVGVLLQEDSKRYYANDMLHLSDGGYGLWFDEIKKSL